jgi:hypothetical protein
MSHSKHAGEHLGRCAPMSDVDSFILHLFAALARKERASLGNC